MIEISKELLSEVLEIEDIAHIQEEGNSSLLISMWKDKSMIINIYELVHECKEWIVSKGYSQLSGKDDIYEKGIGYVCSVGSTILLIKDFYADTESEAIIKACEWILKEIKK